MDFLECYRKAGKIASTVRENAREKNHIGSTMFKICEEIEIEIRKKEQSPHFQSMLV